MFAHQRLRRSIELFASEYTTQVAECAREGGLDLYVYEGPLRAMEMLHGFGAQVMFSDSLWTSLWAFTHDVVSVYERCTGPTDADVLRSPEWNAVRERALRLKNSLPPEVSEEELIEAIRSQSGN